MRMKKIRERREDVKDIVRNLLKRDEEEGLKEKRIKNEGMEMMRRYKWKGNVREIENIVRRIEEIYKKEEIEKEIIEKEIKEELEKKEVVEDDGGEMENI